MDRVSHDLLRAIFDYLSCSDCRQSMEVCVLWLHCLRGRHIHVVQRAPFRQGALKRYLEDAPQNPGAFATTVSSYHWLSHNGAQEWLRNLRWLNVDHALPADATTPLILLPGMVERLVLGGPCRKYPPPILQKQGLVLEHLHDIALYFDIHESDAAELFLCCAKKILRRVHLLEMSPDLTLLIVPRLSGCALQCLRITNANEHTFSPAECESLLERLAALGPLRLQCLSIPVYFPQHDEAGAVGRLGQLLERLLGPRPVHALELVSIHRHFPAHLLWRELLRRFQPTLTKVYWFVDDFCPEETNPYHGPFPCTHCTLAAGGEKPMVLQGSFNEHTDFEEMRAADGVRHVSVSAQMPRRFPRHIQRLDLMCDNHEILHAVFRWLGDAAGQVRQVQSMCLTFGWFGLSRHVPPMFPDLSHAHCLHTLKLRQDGGSHGMRLSGLVQGIGVAPSLQTLVINVAFDDTLIHPLEWRTPLFVALQTLEIKCMDGLPLGANLWMHAEIHRLQITNDIPCGMRQDRRTIRVLCEILEQLSPVADCVCVNIQLLSPSPWPLPTSIMHRITGNLQRMQASHVTEMSFVVVGLCRQDTETLSRISLDLRPQNHLGLHCNKGLLLLRSLCLMLQRGDWCPRHISVHLTHQEYTDHWFSSVRKLLDRLCSLGPHVDCYVYQSRNIWEPSEENRLFEVFKRPRVQCIQL